MKAGDKVYNKKLNLYAVVEFPKCTNGVPQEVFVFAVSGDDVYLIGIEDRMSHDWVLVNEQFNN